jgi:hypothetical protein
MNRSRIVAIVGILMLVAGFAAFADAAPGRLVPITQDIKDFFAARGVDPSYLGLEKSLVPADQWAKIVNIVNTPDVADITTDDHDRLNTLVISALMNETVTTDDPVYMTIGTSSWIHESVSSD